MKKLLFLAVIAALAVGCEVEPPVPNERDAIGFRTMQGTKLFQEVDMHNINSLAVFGEWVVFNGTDTLLQTVNRFDFAYNKHIGRATNGGTTWEYVPTLYWPGTGVINFYAYSPHASVNVANFGINADSAKFTYVNPDNYVKVDPANPKPTTAKKQEDFLVAATKAQSQSIVGTGPVPLMMYHALSQVRFIAKSSLQDVTFEIQEIRILNLDNTAKFNLATVGDGNLYGANPSYVRGRPLPWAWSETEDAKTVDHYALQGGGTAVNYRPNQNEYKMLGEAITIIPQMVDTVNHDAVPLPGVVGDPVRDDVVALTEAQATGKQLVALKYKIFNSDGSENKASTWVFFNLDLNQPDYNQSLNPRIDENKFVMGVRYTFVFDLNLNLADQVPISFDLIGLDDWIDASDYIILK